jgi:tetratricopeptide (TPR) repeat protein
MEVLGRIYGNITGMVKDADTWAIAAYERQVQLDPTTPQARFNLAGAYLVKKNFTLARDQLVFATQLKPNIANIQYNLAYAYRNLKDYANEKLALENALKYVEKGSEDAKKVQGELDTVNALLTPADDQKKETLPVPVIISQPSFATPPAEIRNQMAPKIEIVP